MYSISLKKQGKLPEFTPNSLLAFINYKISPINQLSRSPLSYT